MAVTKSLHIQQAVIGRIAPASYSSVQTTGSTWFDMGQFEQIRFIINIGAMTSTATFNATVQQATTATGTNAKALSPAKALTQLADTGTGQYEIVVKASDLDVNSGFRYVQFSGTPATAAVVFGATVVGSDVRTSPQTSVAIQSVV